MGLQSPQSVRKEFYPPPIRQPIVARQPNPKHLIGIGHQHKGMALSFSGDTSQQKGIFVTSHRTPLFSIDQTILSLHPPPFAQYMQTGSLLSDPMISLAAVSKTSIQLKSSKS